MDLDSMTLTMKNKFSLEGKNDAMRLEVPQGKLNLIWYARDGNLSICWDSAALALAPMNAISWIGYWQAYPCVNSSAHAFTFYMLS